MGRKEGLLRAISGFCPFGWGIAWRWGLLPSAVVFGLGWLPARRLFFVGLWCWTFAGLFACVALVFCVPVALDFAGFFAGVALVSLCLRRWPFAGFFACVALVSLCLRRWPFLEFLLVY
ncbi:hypothetical protein PQR71_33170 [Paraburkholderia fungorum]|uniref:hypothetical protein n=1 Tax=Paraburkholderia fungorum TaxID=134537 RepID=UPI0038BC72DF